jgi:transcriptional regulator with GAF, ATPase, and Fis domain
MDKRDFGVRVGAVARELLARPGVQQTLQGAVDLAAQNIDRQVYASVSVMMRRGAIDTPASSDQRVSHADRLQYELGEGPCLDAIWEHEISQIDDLRRDGRYPRWSRRVVADTGIHSTLSFRLATWHDMLGALNLYSPRPEGFDDDDCAEGFAYAAQVAVALQAARTEEQLQSAIAIRAVIGQAQGILMERYSISADRSFEVLRRVSQDTNTRLREIAERLVANRETPGL